MFSVGRSFIAGKDPEHIARYNRLWQNPSARHTSRVTTVVWGIVYSGDFLLRLLLVFTLPVAAVLAVGPILTGGLIGGTLLWTFAYLRRARQRVQTMQAPRCRQVRKLFPRAARGLRRRRANVAASESRRRKPMETPFATAQSLLVALRRKRISARELLAWHLERIARSNPDLHAIVTFNEEQARQRAALADAAIAKGVLLGPLHGLPVTIKDCIEVAGLPTTAGVPERAHVISPTTAPVAQSVLDAGAVLLGKTNLPPYATDWQTSNALFGRTNIHIIRL